LIAEFGLRARTRDPAWRRRTIEETEAIFAKLGFTSAFWSLR
jgi:hypothetical protein